MKLTFDWQREPEGSVLRSLLPYVLAGMDGELMEHLRLATADWTEVTLKVTVNDVEVPAEKFIARFDDEVTNVAVNAVDTHLNEIAELHNLRYWLDELESVVSDRVQSLAQTHDVDWTPRRDR